MIHEVIIISLFVSSVKLLITDGYLLQSFGRLLKRIAPPKYLIADPLWKCVVCMNSVWGSLVYWGYFHPELQMIYVKEWIIVIIGSVVVTAFIHDQIKGWYQ